MALFDLEDVTEKIKEKQKGPNIKLKKGQTINDLIQQARELVNAKLGKYKDTSKCVLDINELIKFFNEAKELVAIDTETTGLDVYNDELVGISLCNGIECLYIPVNHKNAIYNLKLEGQIAEENIRQLFKQVKQSRKDLKWIYHNAKFDLGILRTFIGEPMPDPYWDTMLAANLLYQDEEHSLKFLYNKYIAEEDEGVNRFDTLFKGITFDYIPLDIATIYAGKDAFMTWELYLYQKQILDRQDMSGVRYVMDNIEVPLLPILEDMQRTGVNLNQKMLKELYDKYSEQLKESEQKVYEEIKPYENDIQRYRIEHLNKKLDDPINIGSPSQLSILFYDILKYKTKNGKGTGVHELEEINTPLTQALLTYRKAQKLIDAFLVALPKRVNKWDNKIHTSLNQYGAATGRFSSSDPNLQQIPSRGEGKELRRLFAASKGNILLSSDFSQQEPRTLASLANELGMKEAYMTGKDLYATMASEIYKLPYADCMEFYLDENGKKTDKTNPEGKKRRSNTKSILLGIMYGRGTASVAEQIHSTVEEAQKIVDDFFEAYPKIKIFVEQKNKEAQQKGYTETAWGRRRYLPHIQDEKYEYHYNNNRPVDFNPLFTAVSKVKDNVPQDIKDMYNAKLEKANYYTRQKIFEQAKKDGIDIIDNSGYLADASRQVVNSTIQGSAADMTKVAMIHIGQNEELKQLGFKMLFPVHDELICECPFVNRKRCGELLSQLMIDAGKERIDVPQKCDVEAFFRWYGEDVPLDDTPEAFELYEEYCKEFTTN